MLRKQIQYTIFFVGFVLVLLIRNERQAEEIGLLLFVLVILIFVYLTHKD